MSASKLTNGTRQIKRDELTLCVSTGDTRQLLILHGKIALGAGCAARVDPILTALLNVRLTSHAGSAGVADRVVFRNTRLVCILIVLSHRTPTAWLARKVTNQVLKRLVIDEILVRSAGNHCNCMRSC